jgi:ADP-dependent NAD(P)H-hydrate dehydratase
VTEGLDRQALSGLPLPELPPDGDKEDRGAVLVVGGGARMLGATALAGLAALRAGAGKLQMRGTPRAVAALAVLAPEAAIIEAHGPSSLGLLARAGRDAAALVVGPGMTVRKRNRRLARDLLDALPGRPAVVDAGAMPSPDEAARFAAAAQGRAVLTPHAGEMAFLLGRRKDEVLKNPLEAARRAASLFRAVVVMKGATTFIVSPDGRTFRHDGGVVGLATSGSGDVLAGAIGGLLARGAPPMTAAAWGVFLHARAGEALAEGGLPLGFLARELLDRLPLGFETAPGTSP